MMNIAALLSGGVDSSVVVHLLCEQGYKPTLFYIKIGMDGAEYMDCSAEEDIEMSTAIARKYGLSLEVVDLHKEYWENVAAYAIDKIKKGLTPNPDVMCNKLIKFGCFEQQVGKSFSIYTAFISNCSAAASTASVNSFLFSCRFIYFPILFRG